MSLVRDDECITEHLGAIFSGIEWVNCWFFTPGRLLVWSCEDHSLRWCSVASICEEDGNQLVLDGLASVVLRDDLEPEVLTVDCDSLELVKFTIIANIISLVEDKVNICRIIGFADVKNLVLVLQVIDSLVPDAHTRDFMGALSHRPGLVYLIFAFEGSGRLASPCDGLRLVTANIDDDLFRDWDTFPCCCIDSGFGQVEGELEHGLTLLFALHEVICELSYSCVDTAESTPASVMS